MSRFIEENKYQMGIIQYAVSQITLEQVFLSLAKDTLAMPPSNS